MEVWGKTLQVSAVWVFQSFTVYEVDLIFLILEFWIWLQNRQSHLFYIFVFSENGVL